MDHDDEFIGRVLSRREALTLMGTAGFAALLSACGVEATPTPTTDPAQADTSGLCVVRPALAEGPFFFDEDLNRSDIRPDPSTGEAAAGTPLQLEVSVYRLQDGTCAPFPEATVNVWHCDAAGVYSGTGPAAERQFLRGYQLTDEQGVARFTTVYPGWYPGRAVHIHFKVRAEGAEFTSQWFFDEATTAAAYAVEPYAGRGLPNTPNQRDGLYRQAGEEMILSATPEDDAYTARFALAMDMNALTSGPQTAPGGPVIQP